MKLFISAGLSEFVLGVGASILVARMLWFLLKNPRLARRMKGFLVGKILLFGLIAAASFKTGIMLDSREHALRFRDIALLVMVVASLIPLWMLTTKVLKDLRSGLA